MIDRLAFAVAGEVSIFAARIEDEYTRQDKAIETENLAIKEIKSYAIRNLDMLVSYETNETLESFLSKSEIRDKSLITKALERQLDIKLRRPYHINIDVQEKWIEIAVEVSGGVLLVAMPQRRLFSSSGYIFILWMMGVSIVMLTIAVLFMRGQIRPIRRLSIVADRFGRGQDMPESFKPEGSREVRQAGEAFIKMQNRLQNQIEQRTIMLAGVSHDLRTPLTRMKLQAAMLGQNPDVEALKVDIQDMEKMLDAYLEFVKGTGREKSERISLSSLLTEAAAKLRRSGVSVETDVSDGLYMTGRPIALERCISNILTNARHYADSVWISLHETAGGVEILIDDDGPGIPETERDEVFRPFVRVDESRNQKTGGVGLGLSISQDTIFAHGGSITLDESPKGGLRVIIKLPI